MSVPISKSTPALPTNINASAIQAASSPDVTTTSLAASKPRVIFLMADTGHDPTETAIPWKVFRDADFDVRFATEKGTQPVCDPRMLEGWTGTLLGAPAAAKKAYVEMKDMDAAFRQPLSWTAASFSLDDFDLVFLPGGHEKGVRQVIESKTVQTLLGNYWTMTKRPDGRKAVAAICHGVQVLSEAKGADGKSILHNVTTTALPGTMEEGIYQATRLFLGDYYKTYGAGSPSVQTFVTDKLDKPEQFKNSLGMSPFVVEDEKYNYMSGRFPPDAELLASKVVEMVKRLHQQS